MRHFNLSIKKVNLAKLNYNIDVAFSYFLTTKPFVWLHNGPSPKNLTNKYTVLSLLQIVQSSPPSKTSKEK